MQALEQQLDWDFEMEALNLQAQQASVQKVQRWERQWAQYEKGLRAYLMKKIPKKPNLIERNVRAEKEKSFAKLGLGPVELL